MESRNGNPQRGGRQVYQALLLALTTRIEEEEAEIRRTAIRLRSLLANARFLHQLAEEALKDTEQRPSASLKEFFSHGNP